ncbi:MAG: zinc ABC transporter substrate-binding protein, partial [Candidatus Thiodiazotropha endolucinida]
MILKHRFFLLLILAMGLSESSVAALKVFACEPEWASLTRALGGDRVAVVSATTAHQDPHRIEARPSLIAKVRRADLLVCRDAELEI